MGILKLAVTMSHVVTVCSFQFTQLGPESLYQVAYIKACFVRGRHNWNE